MTGRVRLKVRYGMYIIQHSRGYRLVILGVLLLQTCTCSITSSTFPKNNHIFFFRYKQTVKVNYVHLCGSIRLILLTSIRITISKTATETDKL